MGENEFQQKLQNLIKQLETVPDTEKPRLEALVSETRDRHDRMKKSIKELQESLDYLRLSVKYLVFDLEATRRENSYLRNLLSNQADGPNPGAWDDAQGSD